MFGSESESPKAQIMCLDNSDWDVKVQFNPTTFKYTRKVQWDDGGGGFSSSAWGQLGYKAGSLDQLDVTLLFDESEDREESALSAASFIPSPSLFATGIPSSSLPTALQPTPTERSVMNPVMQIHRLTMPVNFGSATEPLIRPPAVAFVWGQFQFQGVIGNLTSDFVLFDAEGGARRANITLQFMGRAMTAAKDIETLLAGYYEAPVKSSSLNTAASKDRKDILNDLLKNP